MVFNPEIPIGDLISFSRGGGWGKDEPFDGAIEVAIIRGADFPAIEMGNYCDLPIRYEKETKVKSVALRAGDIVLENSGGTDTRPTGRTLLISEKLLSEYSCPVIPASFCRVVRFDNSVDCEFIYFWLQEMFNAGRTWGYQNRSTGLANFQFKTFSQMELVPSLPLDEQQKIGALLSVIDQKRIANNRLNGYLAELAQTIYNDWFRDFGHWGGQMPSHWETGVLGDYVTIKRGGSPRPIQEYLSDEGLRWLKIADVSGISGPYILEIKEHIKEEGLRKTVHLEPGSLVLSNSATPGIPKILSIDTCIHDGWLYFPQSQFTNEWLYCYFLNVRQELIRMANGSVFQNLKTDIVKNFEVIRPDDETLASFQEMVAPLFNLMESCQKENKQLADLRDTLLPKLMSGEIDVSQVDLTQLNSHLVQRVQIVSQSAVQPNLPSNLTDHPLVGNTLVSCSKPVLSIVEFRSVLHFMKVLDGLVKLPVEFLRGFLHRIKEDLVLIHPEQ